MLLTTITPYWQRPEALRPWLKSIKGASCPEVQHFVYFAREVPPEWWSIETAGTNVVTFVRTDPPGVSIGYYHNLAALQCSTEWIMKLDIDALPNVNYFRELVPMLRAAQPREWFNGGMFFFNRVYSHSLLNERNLPVGGVAYQLVMQNRRTYAGTPYLLPAATNFICRREDYMNLGGCDSRFKGWGWEDYQQIYMLERYWRGGDPLPGVVDLLNVTRRCRDEISRPKARELWERNPWLCLFHRWHAGSSDTSYRSSSSHNRQILLDWILSHR